MTIISNTLGIYCWYSPYHLSLTGRIQLVKSVIHGMLICSFKINVRPISLIELLDHYLRNLFWSGDVDSRLMSCHGCLGHNLYSFLRRWSWTLLLKTVNNAAMLKFNWELVFQTTSELFWLELEHAIIMPVQYLNFIRRFNFYNFIRTLKNHKLVLNEKF